MNTINFNLVQWLKPLIPATQETEIRMIMVWGYHRQKVNENPKAGMMTHTCNPSYIEGIGRSMVVHRQPWVKIVRPYLKNNPKRQKRTRILLKWWGACLARSRLWVQSTVLPKKFYFIIQGKLKRSLQILRCQWLKAVKCISHWPLSPWLPFVVSGSLGWLFYRFLRGIMCLLSGSPWYGMRVMKLWGSGRGTAHRGCHDPRLRVAGFIHTISHWLQCGHMTTHNWKQAGKGVCPEGNSLWTHNIPAKVFHICTYLYTLKTVFVFAKYKYIYIYMYTYVCVCVCACHTMQPWITRKLRQNTHKKRSQ
jgi:hypothetical protein